MKNLITELAQLFQGLPQEVVEKAFKEATKQVYLPASLSKLFDAQMENLRQRNCPKNIIDEFIGRKDEVVEKAMKMEIPQDHAPFIPIIPRTEVDLQSLMEMINIDGKKGSSYPKEDRLMTNVVSIPPGLYFIYDIEDGKNMLGKSPREAEKLIKNNKRSCLITEEGIALSIHSNLLNHHNVDCTGSRYEQGGRVPYVYLGGGGPELGLDGVGNSHGEWGSASCCSRF